MQITSVEHQLSKSTSIPLIGCFDDRPFRSSEIYWAAEEPHWSPLSWQPFDRGLHLLVVGEQQWRRSPLCAKLAARVTRYLLLNEPHTRRAQLLEPRIDDQRLFRPS
ncbi:GNAT family N-acetyltransferase [Shigella flexneri]